MDNLTKEVKTEIKSIDKICSDFDEDCLSMSPDYANWCFLGCMNHPCNPTINLGTAEGYCPIIHKTN